MWYFIHHSGIHATIAGVLTALTVPTTPDATESPLEKLEHFLTQPVNFLIMPIFALANTNIKIEAGMFQAFFGSLGTGILVGLLIGKPVGISALSWIAIKLRFASLPEGAKPVQLFAVSILGGIGFTMSIFIALLSFSDPGKQDEAKFVILITSILAGLLGFFLLKFRYRKVLDKPHAA
jgi:NhaA family Na+:H+ antiporter